MPAMNVAAQQGQKQSILDLIANVDPGETPFFSMLRRGKKPLQSLDQWQGEVYPDRASTGVLDGAPVTTINRVDRYPLATYVQQFRETWGVTKRANLTQVAGVETDERGHQKLAAALLLRRQVEVQICSADDCRPESGSTPYATRGVHSWIASSAQTNQPVPSALLPAAAVIYTSAASSIGESTLKGQLEAASKGRNAPVDLDAFVGITLKGLIDDIAMVVSTSSNTTAPRTIRFRNETNRFNNTITVIEMSAGIVRFHVSHFQNRTTTTGAKAATSDKCGVALDMDMWELGIMQDFQNKDLADDGAGPRGYIDTFLDLRCLTPLGQCAWRPSS